MSIICFLLMSLDMKAQTAEFETASEAVKNMKVGWNLANTLESLGDWIYPEGWWSWETGWGNPITKPEFMKMMRKAGFNAIRVPVTWFPHMDANNQVDPAWMKRVHEVVDYVIDQGMYCILNTHHETAGEADEEWHVTKHAKLEAIETNYNENKEWFEDLWRQIAEEFKDCDEHLLFEGYNEMINPDDGYDEAKLATNNEVLNKYAQSFVNAVRSTGGNNKYRNLVVSTYGGNLDLINLLKVPSDETKGHIVFQIHYYPDVYSISEDEMNSKIEEWTKAIQAKDVPLVVGEWEIWKDVKLRTEGLRILGDGFTITSVVLIPGEYSGKKSANEIILWEGNQVFDNWESTLKIDGDKLANAKVGDIIRIYYKDRTTDFMPCFKHAVYWDDWPELQEQIDIQETYFQALITEAVGGDISSRNISLSRYFVERTKADGIATFLFGSPAYGQCRSLPAFESRDYVSALMKGYYGDSYEPVIVTLDDYDENGKRKQSIHTVEYDFQWAELNIFYDDVPLKLKNYKGIRLELAEAPKDVNIKVYGDGEQREDYLGMNSTSTTILFNTDIYSNEINRVTLQNNSDGKTQVKVISAWLIRQDGTEEYSDLSPFHGCAITNTEPYTTDIKNVKVNRYRETHVDSRIYNLSGQRLSKPQKGINIINGKKVIMK